MFDKIKKSGGWFEEADHTGKAPRHREVALRETYKNTLRRPIYPDEIIEKTQDKRTDAAVRQDNQKTADIVLEKAKQEDVLQWSHNPERLDLRCVDTKKSHLEDIPATPTKSTLKEKYKDEVALYEKDQPETEKEITVNMGTLQTLEKVKFPEKGKGFTDDVEKKLWRRLRPDSNDFFGHNPSHSGGSQKFEDLTTGARNVHSTIEFLGADKLKKDSETKAKEVLSVDEPENFSKWQKNYILGDTDKVDLEKIDTPNAKLFEKKGVDTKK